MSINTLTNDEVMRNSDFRAAALAANAAPEVVAQDNQITNTVNVLFKYIPTESVTLYIAAVSAAPALKTQFPFITDMQMYWFFAALTPLLSLLIFAGKRRTSGLSLLPSVAQWPWWTVVAATIAFLAWALAVPGNQLLEGEAGGAIAAFIALVTSTILSLVEPIFRRGT
jgi:amino acid transporter